MLADNLARHLRAKIEARLELVLLLGRPADEGPRANRG